MKSIVIMRHARAKRSGKSDDRKRALTAKGVESAKCVARDLIRENVIPGIIYTSDARRAVDTAKILAKETGISQSMIVQISGWYEAFDEKILLDYAGKFSDGIHTAAVVGHNPFIPEMLYRLFPDFSENVSPGSAVVLSFETESWAGIHTAARSITSFKIPFNADNFKEKNDEICRRLSDDIEQAVMNTLEALPWKYGRRIAPHVSFCARSIASKAIRTIRVVSISSERK